MRNTQFLLLPDGWEPGAEHPSSAASAALAAELGLDERAFAAMLGLAFEAAAHRGERVAVLPVVTGGADAQAVVAVRLPAAERGPGAPGAAERFREAGLALGACAHGGTIWWDGQEGGDADRLRDALWTGVRLGADRPGTGQESRAEVRFKGADAVGERARDTADALAWVRELVERPANLLGPAELADEIGRFAADHGRGIVCEVWAGEELLERGFGALRAVGGGSERAPRTVRLRWGAADPEPRGVLGVVGKGVTFDSGGANIKGDAEELAWMKSDMAASVTAVAALVLASRRGAPGAPVELILPLCDNAVSGSAMRPGDVVTHPGGRTTEIVDTDCEGRLILADGICWLREEGAAAIIDIGTLTDGGAGLRQTGLWANDARFADELVALSRRADDPLWPLPLPYGEDEILESRVADARNAPMDRPDMGRHAALFLAAAAGETRWAHLDIGGVAYLESPIGGWPEGPTGAASLAIAAALNAWADGALHS